MNSLTGMDSFVMSVINYLNLGLGIMAFLGFLSLLYEVWDRSKGDRLAGGITSIGMLALVLTLVYSPGYIVLTLPVLLIGLNMFSWRTEGCYRHLLKVGEKIEFNIPQHPLFSNGAKWLTAAVIAICLTSAVRQSANNIEASQQSVLRETKSAKKEIITVVGDKVEDNLDMINKVHRDIYNVSAMRKDVFNQQVPVRPPTSNKVPKRVYLRGKRTSSSDTLFVRDSIPSLAY